jgi:hypothetical protein
MITDSPEGIANNDVMSEKVTDAQISPPSPPNKCQPPLLLQWLACLGGRIFVRPTFSLIIIHNSFGIIQNQGGIHILM